MTIKETKTGDALTVELEGRLDTTTSPELDAFLDKYYPIINELIFDLKGLDYLSSSGLRVFLKAQKAMMNKGGVLIRNANRLVMGVFSVTGFDSLLRFE
ncbi:MAG: STAS domain-containing protein [Clostridia bacterium]|nr:STAS domain-containing protein [Clostridia bacterium]